MIYDIKIKMEMKMA